MGHEHFADAPDREGFDGGRDDGKRSRVQDRPKETAEDHDGDEHSTPIETDRVLIFAPGEQNRENDQDLDSADVDEYLDQSDEFRAQEEEERGETDKGHHQTERRVDELAQTGGRERAGQHDHGDNEKGGGAHSAKR